jgi:DNA mismatch endonuclease (patch repair protein)
LQTASSPCFRQKTQIMPDIFPPSKRSRIMANVKGRNTSPERLIRKCLRRLHCRFRGNVRTIPGKPDFVLAGQRKLIFMHGCFWHGHNGCPRATIPETNRAFWKRKIEGNSTRDVRILRLLRKDGWKVLIIWQCETKDMTTLERRILNFMAR